MTSRGLRLGLVNLRRPTVIEALIILLLALLSVTIAHASSMVSLTYTVSYINYYTSSGLQSYIRYSVEVINENASSISLRVGFNLPPYSTIVYYTSGATISGDKIYWNIYIGPFQSYSLSVEFQNPLISAQMVSFKYMLNGTKGVVSAINATGNLSLVTIIEASNYINLPQTYNIYIPLVNNVNYYYSPPPSGIMSISAGAYTYWSGELANNGSLSLNITYIVPYGNWSVVNLGSLVFTTSIDLTYYLQYLKLLISQLNETLIELGNVTYMRPISGNATILLSDIRQLADTLNTTALLYRQTAYYLNSTRIIESLLLVQVYELDYVLSAEYRVLKNLNATIPVLRRSIWQIMGNLTALNGEIAKLQDEVVSDLLYFYGQLESYNATINTMLPILSVVNGIIGDYYAYLTTIQYALIKLYNEVESININLANVTQGNLTQGILANITQTLYSIKAQILGSLAALIGNVGSMRDTLLRIQGYVNSVESGMANARSQINSLAQQVETRGIAITETLTNISNTLVKTNTSLYSLYLALGYVGSLLNNSVVLLNQSLGRLNLAISLPTPIYGNLSSIVSGLLNASSGLSNASVVLNRLYLNITGQYMLFMLSLNQTIAYQRAGIERELAQYGAYYAYAYSIYSQYLGNLFVNGTSSYSVDLVLQQYDVVNLPIVVNVGYIYRVLSNVTSPVNENTDLKTQGNPIVSYFRQLGSMLAWIFNLVLYKLKNLIYSIINLT